MHHNNAERDVVGLREAFGWVGDLAYCLIVRFQIESILHLDSKTDSRLKTRALSLGPYLS